MSRHRLRPSLRHAIRAQGTPGGAAGGPWYQNGSALANSLVAYWKLDEASGARADSVGNNHLTDNNTVGSNTGLVYPLAADFVAANSESLSVASNSSLQAGNVDWWIAAWFRVSTLSGDRGIFGKYGSGWEYLLYTTGTGLAFRTGTGGSTSAGDRGIAGLSTNTWYFAVGWHDATAQTTNLNLNNGTTVSGARTNTLGTNTQAVRIGAFGGTPTGFTDGLIGPVMFGKGYVPTADDIAFLYNSGNGRA